jgi:hypothetical protein
MSRAERLNSAHVWISEEPVFELVALCNNALMQLEDVRTNIVLDCEDEVA